MFVAIIYLASVKLCGGINTSVRIFGDHGVLSVLLYMIIGLTGTFLYLTGFAIAENTSWLSWICDVFAYFGRHTMVLLATHAAVYAAMDSAIGYLQLGYAATLIKVTVATAMGVFAGMVVNRLGEDREWIRWLG